MKSSIFEIYSGLVKLESMVSICSRLGVAKHQVVSAMYVDAEANPRLRRDLSVIKTAIKYGSRGSAVTIFNKLNYINPKFIQFIMNNSQKKNMTPTIISKGDNVLILRGPFAGKEYKVLNITSLNIHDVAKLEYINIDTGSEYDEEYVLETWALKV